MILLGAGTLAAETVSWTGAAGNGSWIDPLNWSPPQVPGDLDDVVISLDGDYEISVDTAASIRSLDLSGANSGTQKLTIGTSRSLAIQEESVIGSTGLLVVSINSTLAVEGDLSIAGELNWIAGTIEGGGTVVITPQGQGVFDSLVAKNLDGTLRNEGVITWFFGPLFLRGGTLENVGTFFLSRSGSVNWSGTPGVLHNQGLIVRPAELGSNTLVADVINDGVIDIQGGEINVEGLFEHRPGGILLGGGTIDFSLATLTHDGTLSPGAIREPDVLEYAEDLDQTSPTALLSIYAEGTSAGLEHSQLSVTGDGTIGGAIELEMAPNYAPSIGDAFTVLTCSGDCTDASPSLVPTSGVDLSVEVDEAADEVIVEVVDVFSAVATGICPTAIELNFSGATPGGSVVIVRSTALGDFIAPGGGACPGLALDLDSPQVQTTGAADGEGDITLGPLGLSESACGFYFQAVDVATCTASTVGQIPAIAPQD